MPDVLESIGRHSFGSICMRATELADGMDWMPVFLRRLALLFSTVGVIYLGSVEASRQLNFFELASVMRLHCHSGHFDIACLFCTCFYWLGKISGL